LAGTVQSADNQFTGALKIWADVSKLSLDENIYSKVDLS